MQIIINAPDNLPQAIIQQQIKELETRLLEQAQRLNNKYNKSAKEQAIMEIAKCCASLPDLDSRSSDEILGYSESPMGLWGDEFFKNLQPLESFADIQPEQWVENLRSNSRLLK